MNAIAQVWTDVPNGRPWTQGSDAAAMSAINEPRSLQDSDPAALILAIALKADRGAFTALFNHFAPRVKSYLMRLGAPAVAAEELAQETLLTVWRKAGQYDPARAGASTWIFTIARNLRIDAIRRERPAPAEEDPSDAAPEPLADAVMAATQRDERVRGALQSLSKEQAEIVQLSFFSDHPHSEIAERLGLPLGTVKSRLRLAMARLRGLLEDLQ
jgi:RNA polymerase sigma-70 factor (ECF subfamily)